MSLKIEVLNFLEKACYKPLPNEVPVSTYDKEEGWFHFHKNIWHPLGIVKASAVRGKVAKKDQVINGALKIELEIAVEGEYHAQFDPCIQTTLATSNSAYWFRAVCPKMNCQTVLRFRVVGDDSIAPLEHVIKVGTGILDWPTKSGENTVSTEEPEERPHSPRKRGAKSQATPQQQSKVSLILQETPASARKRTRGGDSVETPTVTRGVSLDLGEAEEAEEDAPRSSRRRRQQDADDAPVHSGRKRRHDDAIMIEEDDEEEEEESIPVASTGRSGRRSTSASTSESAAPSSSANKRSTKATPVKSSSKDSLIIDESSDDSMDYDDATLLSEASSFFETLRAAPIAPALLPKNREETAYNMLKRCMK